VLVKKMVILLMILGVGRWVHFVNKDGQQAWRSLARTKQNTKLVIFGRESNCNLKLFNVLSKSITSSKDSLLADYVILPICVAPTIRVQQNTHSLTESRSACLGTAGHSLRTTWNISR
jgi:hypothetical protein